MQLKHAQFEERIAAEETRKEELQNKVDDLEYELTKSRMRNGKLETALAETQEKLKMYVDRDGGTSIENKVVLSGAERKTVEQMNHDLEEQRELATNRLMELERLNSNYKDSLKEVEKLKMELSTLPEHVVVETTEHKCLQSQFSVLYNEAMQLKTQLEDARNQLQVAKNCHMRQIEQMESEELLAQKKLRTEVIQLEDMLAQVRKEYEMLRIEFEQNLAANEQTGPINKEMRNLITSLQSHNVQLKGEVSRYKRKCKEMQSENTKLRKDVEDLKNAELKSQQQQRQLHQPAPAVKKEAIKEEIKSESGVEGQVKLEALEESSGGDTINLEKAKAEGSAEEHKAQLAGGGDDSTSMTPVDDSSQDVTSVKSESDVITIKEDKSLSAESAATIRDLKEQLDEAVRTRAKEQETVKELKGQLKKAQNDLKEMKLLLDMYKTCPKEQREKVQILMSEKKALAALEDARQQLKKAHETKKEEKKRLADEDAAKRIRHLEEQCAQLQKQVANHKQEEEALLSEMEVTGTAFEDMQEQNSRLIQQLREKDDANFKLMSERIKSNQIQRLAREERDMLVQQVNTLTTQVEAQNQVVRKLEEKERLLQNNLQTMEKELSMRQQAMEMHKRKAIESAQSAADLKLHLEKYHAQIKEVRSFTQSFYREHRGLGVSKLLFLLVTLYKCTKEAKIHSCLCTVVFVDGSFIKNLKEARKLVRRAWASGTEFLRIL